MFIVKMIDIGGDGLLTEFNSTVDTLVEVEILVVGAISQHLGCYDISLEHHEDLVYTVWLNGRDIGTVSIKDVNSKPERAKNASDTGK